MSDYGTVIALRYYSIDQSTNEYKLFTDSYYPDTTKGLYTLARSYNKIKALGQLKVGEIYKEHPGRIFKRIK